MLGAVLGNYRLVAQLGEGGVGVVYVGRHETLGHRVAVKVLRLEMSRNTDMVQRFFNEAQAATAIHNPGIAQVFDFGTTPEGLAFIVMELLEGETLTARLEQRRIEHAECCRLGRQIANVMHAAHAAGITHRDLKPDNLFLVPDAEVQGGERVKVLDFGIAKLAVGFHAPGVQTRTGMMMGTPNYMAPEQCRGAGGADARSDIYSLGCVLFRMACGRPPFVGAGLADIIGAHLHVPPPAPQRLAPDIPPALARLILHMLAKQPGERPQTMAAVSQALDELLHDAPRARPPTAHPPRARSPTARPSATTLSQHVASPISAGSSATFDGLETVPVPVLASEDAVTNPDTARVPTFAPEDAATNPDTARDPALAPEDRPTALYAPVAPAARDPAATRAPPHAGLPVQLPAPAAPVQLPAPAAPALFPRAPRSFPVPQIRPAPPTLGTSAGLYARQPRGRPWRHAYVLGGFALAGVVTALAIALSSGIPAPPPRPPAVEQATPPRATATADAATADAATADAATAAPR